VGSIAPAASLLALPQSSLYDARILDAKQGSTVLSSTARQDSRLARERMMDNFTPSSGLSAVGFSPPLQSGEGQGEGKK
jgi:hypothetical protein